MNGTQWLVASLFATTIAITCCCGAEEEHAVTIWTPESLAVTRDGVTRKIDATIRASAPPVSPPQFQFVYNTLEGNTIGDGIALSVSTNDPVSDEVITVALALPMSLRVGDVYTVGGTYALEPGLDNAPGVFGAYDLQQSDQAEVSFSVSTYMFPPGVYNPTFRAVTSSGTVRVTERERGRVGLLLNLTLTDAAGKTATVTGRMHAVTERTTPPCTS